MKGFMFDIMYGMIAVVIIIMALMVGTMIMNAVGDSGMFDNNPTANESISYAQTGLSVFDEAMVIIVIAIGLGAIVTAFMVDSHPLLFLAFIIINAIMWFVLPPIANIMESVLLSSGIASTTNDIPISLLIIQYMPMISIIFGFILAIVTGIPRGANR